MLYRNLLRHQWKEFIRNPSWSGISVAYAIFLVLLALYFLLILALSGAFIGHLLTSQDPAADVVRVVNQHLLSGFLLLFLTRLLFQNTPQVKIGPYLHLPISRPALARFFSFAALFHLHNLLPLAFFIPFWISNLTLDYPAFTSLSWLAGIVAVLGLSNYLVICVRLVLIRRALPVWILGGGVSGLIALDYWQQWGYTSALSSAVFDSLLGPGGPVLALALLAATCLLFGLTCRLLKDHLHDETPSEKGFTTGSQSLLDRLADLGPVGRLMALEIKLAIRNKRPRQIPWSALMFVPLGLINFMLLTRDSSDFTFLHYLWGCLLTSGFVINYGQFMFGWESLYFDGHLARPVQFRHLLWAKLLLLQISCPVLALVCLPFLLIFAPELLVTYSVFLLYNIGFSSACMLFFATMNRKRLYIARSSFFNQEGTSLHHLLVIIPLLAPPAILMLATNFGPLAIAVGGLLCWTLSPVWVRLLAHRLQKCKYRMAAGFRGST
ncbi:MAG: hypothetical protein F4Z57_02640 [Gemmatimonadetes bacterium]|nr:DUF5687 family protein [Gemmatimonadota bacterium]MXW77886.1 hypothetical protein [Gemmatimonadota bacterium]MYC72413.1 hypothetical protein [Gemmatimonadota bacterium]MYI60895.1 hypothetical protein [Gemmatimonadota bacterium]